MSTNKKLINEIPEAVRSLPVAERGTYIGPEIHHTNCFGCGELNPAGLNIPATFDVDKGIVYFEHQLGMQSEGAPGHSHGGILATLLDEAQGVLCHHLGHFVMTDNLFIKYHRAVPLLKTLIVEAHMTTVRKRRMYTKATIRLKETDELLVESKAKWFIIPEKVLARKFNFERHPDGVENISEALTTNRTRAKSVRNQRRKQNHKHPKS